MAKRRSDVDYLTSVDDDFIDCRVFGHRFEGVGDYMNGQYVYLVQQCARCDSYVVIEWHKSAGTNNPRRYKYTPGYLNKTGNSFTKDEARLEKISRTTFGGSKEFDKLMEKIDREQAS